MLEGLFNLAHLLIMLLSALFVFGIPLVLVFRLARRLDKRLQIRPGVRVSFVAVVLGGITACVASTILTLPFVIYVMVKYDPLHAPEGSAARAFSVYSIGWLYALAIGFGCSVVGGYIAARVAKHDELLNGLLSSFLSIAIGIYPVVSSWHSQSAFAGIFSLLAAPAFALLGGYLRQTQKRMGRTAGILGPPPDVH
jgi:hypothetical protein